MSRVTIDSQTQAQLANVSQPVVIVDSDGNRLGVFTPSASSSAYEGVDSPASNEELQSRMKNPARVSHEDVMRQVRELL